MNNKLIPDQPAVYASSCSPLTIHVRHHLPTSNIKHFVVLPVCSFATVCRWIQFYVLRLGTLNIIVRERSALATLIFTSRVCLSFVLSFCLSATWKLNISKTRPDSEVVPMNSLLQTCPWAIDWAWSRWRHVTGWRHSGDVIVFL